MIFFKLHHTLVGDISQQKIAVPGSGPLWLTLNDRFFDSSQCLVSINDVSVMQF